MFRTRYAPNNSQSSYFRQRYNTFNISSTLNTVAAGNDRNMDIYNEDEEMTPAIDIETEESNDNNMETEEVSEELDTNDDEVSEDDIELESEYYERVMTEFDERDEDEGDMEDEYDTSEEDSDEEEIVDKSFSSEEMPQTFGEFAPYFKNITESLFFCWMQKHHICKLDSFETLNDIKHNLHCFFTSYKSI